MWLLDVAVWARRALVPADPTPPPKPAEPALESGANRTPGSFSLFFALLSGQGRRQGGGANSLASPSPTLQSWWAKDKGSEGTPTGITRRRFVSLLRLLPAVI